MKALRLLVLFAITSIHTPDAGSAAPTSPQRTPATEPRCPGAPARNPERLKPQNNRVQPRRLFATPAPLAPTAIHTPGQ